MRGQALKKIISIASLVMIIASGSLSYYLMQDNKPQTAQAATFNSDRVISFGTQYDGQDLIVDGATVTIDGEHRFNNVTIRNGGKITHSAVDSGGKTWVSPDYFTAKWNGYVQLTKPRLYNPSNNPYFDKVWFGITCDGDGARLGYRKVGSTSWNWQGSINGTATNVGATLTWGMYEIIVQYIEKTGSAKINVSANIINKPLGSRTAKPIVNYYLKQDKSQGVCGTSSATTGLCGEYFANRNSDDPFSGTPNIKRIDSTINFDWGDGSPFGKKKGGLRLIVDGEVKLESGGSIDVSGKGYSGGGAGEHGFGPGGGYGEGSKNNARSGGGGHGGEGGNNGGRVGYGDTYPADYPRDFPDVDKLELGSGGGGAHGWGSGRDARTNGGNGGGMVYIKAGKISVLAGGTASSYISANGYNGGHQHTSWGSNDAYGGGGSGGLVWIVANNYNFHPSLPSVSYTGGNKYDGRGGSDGTYDRFTFVEAKAITVNGGYGGGSDGGGGGGGRIVIGDPSAGLKKTLIPSADGKYYAGDTVTYNISYDLTLRQIELSGGTQANPTYLNPAYSGFLDITLNGGYFETDGNFIAKNLTLKNGAVLSHSPANRSGKVVRPEYSGDAGLTLTIFNKLLIENNSRIDVSGRGYPGANSILVNGAGSGGGKSINAGNMQHVGGGGGGYGGRGGAGYSESSFQSWTIGTDYTWGNGAGQLGSGGGAGRGRWGGLIGIGASVENAAGSAGGGRVHIISKIINLSSGSIVANGQHSYSRKKNTTSSSHYVAGGAGSGGSIFIQTEQLDNSAGGQPNVNGGPGGSRRGGANLGSYDGPSSAGNNIRAIGGTGGLEGDGLELGGSGGGGRIRIDVGNLPDMSLKIVDRPQAGLAIDGNEDFLKQEGQNYAYKTISEGESATLPIMGRLLNIGNICNEAELAIGDPQHRSNPFRYSVIKKSIVCISNVQKRQITIKGDAYGRGSVNLPADIQSGSIVAGGSVSIGGLSECGTAPTAPTSDCVHVLRSYTSLDIEAAAKKSNLQNILNKAVPFTSIPSPANLNSTTTNLSGAGNKNPEGGIWKHTIDSTTPPYTINHLAYTNRGTIILECKVTCTVNIAENINRAAGQGEHSALGLIVRKHKDAPSGTTIAVNISNTVRNIRAAIYVEGSVNFVPGGNAGLTYTGYLVSHGSIRLPNRTGATKFTYNPLLNPSQRPLPGFAGIQDLTISPIAP
jgi:hypothetical protein